MFSLFTFSETTFATGTTNETELESYKWFKVEASVPTDFEFTMTVVVEVLNQKTGEKLIVNVKKEDDYVSYINVVPGEYVVSSVQIPGNYEGYFTFGYPENVFTITDVSKETTVIPVIAELHLQELNPESSQEQNLFEGMTYDEVMSHIATEESSREPEEESIGETNDVIDEIVSGIADANEELISDSKKENVEQEEAVSFEDKIAQEKEEQEREVYRDQAQDEQQKSLMGGIVVMCLAFIGLGVGYYLVKRNM